MSCDLVIRIPSDGKSFTYVYHALIQMRQNLMFLTERFVWRELFHLKLILWETILTSCYSIWVLTIPQYFWNTTCHLVSIVLSCQTACAVKMQMGNTMDTVDMGMEGTINSSCEMDTWGGVWWGKSCHVKFLMWNGHWVGRFFLLCQVPHVKWTGMGRV